MILDLATIETAGASAGDASVSPRDTSILKKADASVINALREGGVRIAPSRLGEAEIISAARPVVIKQILSILGSDLPDPYAFTRYLDTLPYASLCARRDQYLRERQPALFNAETQRHGGAK